jgi:signal transduction histidine kinase
MNEKECSKELQNRLIKLEKLNDQRIGELKLVNKKLEESESLKSHFISNVTNEIINPFTSIIGLSKSIMSVKKEDWKRVITMVAMIHSEAFSLDFQLRNIFVAAKIESGEINPEITQVDIARLIQGVMDQFSMEARRKSVRITHKNRLIPNRGKKTYFCTDAEKLKVILANLLSNAVKFSNDSGDVEVISETCDGGMKFTVRDYGRGISEANQKIIFDRFKRVDSGISSINRGHGLGLSIIKSLLDILEGNIVIDSQVNQGAHFAITIPGVDSDTADTAVGDRAFLFDEMDQGELF